MYFKVPACLFISSKGKLVSQCHLVLLMRYYYPFKETGNPTKYKNLEIFFKDFITFLTNIYEGFPIQGNILSKVYSKLIPAKRGNMGNHQKT